MAKSKKAIDKVNEIIESETDKYYNEVFEALASGDLVKTKLLHPTDGLIAIAKEIKKLQK